MREGMIAEGVAAPQNLSDQIGLSRRLRPDDEKGRAGTMTIEQDAFGACPMGLHVGEGRGFGDGGS